MPAPLPIPDLDPADLEWTAIRAQGAGGQNVNKVASAVHLRFDIHASALPGEVKTRLLSLPDRRISEQGVIVIKAQRHNSQPKNREEAIGRLRDLIGRACRGQKPRKPTRPTAGARRRRLEAKSRRGRVKALRRNVEE